MIDSYNSAPLNKEDLVKRRKRPNPAVASSERAARAAEEMAELASKNPLQTNLGQRIAQRKRATADKIRKDRPNLIQYGE